MTRPVAEIAGGIHVPVHPLPGDRAAQQLVQPVLAFQPARAAVRPGAAMVQPGGGEPAIGDRKDTAMAPCLVVQLGADTAEGGIGHRPAERPPAHAALHRGEVQVLHHDLAVGCREAGGQLVGCFEAEVDAAAVEALKLGFRLMPAAGPAPPGPRPAFP